MPPKTASNAGFTLIEVLLAMGLTTLLLGLLSTSVFIVAGDWNRNSNSLDESLDLSLALLQVDRSLHGAFPHSYTNEDTLNRQIYFTGENDSLSWVSTVSPQRSSGLTAWELSAVPGEGVYLKLAPAFSDNPSLRLNESNPVLLFPGYDLEFSYLYEELDQNKVWTDSWEARDLLSLPLAVYARLVPNSDINDAFEIIARIRNSEHRSIRPNELERLDL
ncbi:MAG: prepilin-type N-terminal cleavage/methylation domain-containing protein [Pseudohongiellaceae bacterium]